MKKTISLFLILVLSIMISVPVSAKKTDESYVTKFGVIISENEYQELKNQGLRDDDIAYLDENTFDKYMAEAGGQLISSVENYYICKENGGNIEVSQNVAEEAANNINCGIMTAEDDAAYDSANDGVCRLTLNLYKSGNNYRCTTYVIWLTNPTLTSKDVLGIAYNAGFICDSDDITTTSWYDYTVDGTNYTTVSGVASSMDPQVGQGAVCTFDRVVTSPMYDYPHRNFRYKIEADLRKNSNADVIYAIVQADYYRAIKTISLNVDVDAIAVLNGIASQDLSAVAEGVSIQPEFKDDFAQRQYADVLYTINP